MATYRFIQSTIHSCVNQEQLQSCIQWIDNIDIPEYMKDAVQDEIRIKSKSLMNQ